MPDRFFGGNWNTDDNLPTLIEDYRFCPNCNGNYKVRIVAYSDEESWNCPHCKARIILKPENGRYKGRVNLEEIKKPDSTREISDFKRNTDRRYLTGKRRKQLGLE